MSVYFAQSGPYIKIGFSANPIRRASEATTTSHIRPADVERGACVDVLGFIPGDRTVERETHMRFGHLHVVGEWFNDTREIRDWLEAHPESAIPEQMSMGAVVSMMRGVSKSDALAAFPCRTEREALDELDRVLLPATARVKTTAQRRKSA